MRMKRYIQLIIGMLLGVAVSACDVHEFPEYDYLEFDLELKYDTAMPLFESGSGEVTLKTRAELAELSKQAAEYRVRYIIEAYRTNLDGSYDSEEEAYIKVVKYEDNIVFDADGRNINLDKTFTLHMVPGNFTFVIWTDYIKKGTESDLYYDTNDFGEIKTRRPHSGSNDFRDAFRGEVFTNIGYENLQASATLTRPFGKFNIISTDLQEFITRVIQMRLDRNLLPEKPADGPEETRAVNLEDFTVKFIYDGSIPYTYNVKRNFPADINWGFIVEFESTIERINDEEVELGFDYVMVNPKGSEVKLGLEVYDYDNTLVSSVNPFPIKLMPSMLTTKRGEFLTSKAVGGVGIKPGFNEDPDGEFNYVVPD